MSVVEVAVGLDVAEGGWEYEVEGVGVLWVLVVLVGLEDVDEFVWEGDLSAGSWGFGFGEDGALGGLSDGVLDVEGVVGEVDVVPGQGACFAAAASGEEEGGEEGVVAVVSGVFEEGGGLVLGEDAHGGVGLPWGCGSVGGVVGGHFPSDGLFEGAF